MIENYIKDLKSDYEKVQAPLHLKMSGWDDVAKRIGANELQRTSIWLRNFAIGFVILLIFLGGTYKIADASTPGDFLYPVKLLSEKIIQGTSGSSQIIINHRAQEIISLSKKQSGASQELKQVVTDYKVSVNDEEKQIENMGKTDPQFQANLEKQHQEFDKIAHENPEIEKEIQDAQNASNRKNDNGED